MKQLGRRVRRTGDGQKNVLAVSRFSKGTFAKMDALRRPRETRTELVREAVDHELARLEKERPLKSNDLIVHGLTREFIWRAGAVSGILVNSK